MSRRELRAVLSDELWSRLDAEVKRVGLRAAYVAINALDEYLPPLAPVILPITGDDDGR